MNELTFSVELVNALLQYLGSRPYVETAGLIAEMQKQAAAQGAQPAPAEVPAEAPAA